MFVIHLKIINFPPNLKVILYNRLKESFEIMQLKIDLQGFIIILYLCQDISKIIEIYNDLDLFKKIIKILLFVNTC